MGDCTRAADDSLRLIHGDAHGQIQDGERSTDEGGSFRSDVTAPLPARAAGGVT